MVKTVNIASYGNNNYYTSGQTLASDHQPFSKISADKTTQNKLQTELL